MTRLAVGGKLGKPARPGVACPERSNSAARAATPRGVRVRNSRRLGTSFFGDSFIEIQDGAGYGGPGGQFYGIDFGVRASLSVLEESLGLFAVSPVGLHLLFGQGGQDGEFGF